MTEPDSYAVNLSSTINDPKFDQVGEFHHWMWRWLRKSDPVSLAYLRCVLFAAGIMTPNPDLGWNIDRGLADYIEAFGSLGFSEETFNTLQEKALTGLQPPSQPFQVIDTGAGNATFLYEVDRPWLVCTGTALSRDYSLDGTLRNWLHEPYRGTEIKGYRSDLLRATLLALEEWTILHFIGIKSTYTKPDPIKTLRELTDNASGLVRSSDLRNVLESAQHQMSDWMREIERDSLVATVALSSIIDALAGHVVVPNGMQFFYGDPHLKEDELGAIKAALAAVGITDGVIGELLSNWPLVEECARAAKGHQDDPKLLVMADEKIQGYLPNLGDLFREAGFELRSRMSNDQIVDVLYSTSNTLWRWHFFLLDQQRWITNRSTARSAFASRSTVKTWLERIWGVLRVHDAQIALGELPDGYSGLPSMTRWLMPLFRSDVDAFLATYFPEEQARKRLDQLVAHRCILRDLRGHIAFVYHEKSADSELAQLLIDLLTIWFYSQPQSTRQGFLAHGLTPLRELIDSGTWLSSLGSIPDAPMLSRRQDALLREYREAPQLVAARLFELSKDDNLCGRLDFFL